MPIDIHSDELLTFRDLAKALPPRRQGRPIHLSTIHRWRSRGLRGIKLEAVRIGGAWHTSWEAFARFCRALTDDQTISADTSRNLVVSNEDVEIAAATLDREGF